VLTCRTWCRFALLLAPGPAEGIDDWELIVEVDGVVDLGIDAESALVIRQCHLVY
jgi:hypothetical protein